MRFQLLSDVHMRNGPHDLEVAPGAEMLLLAGDIGNANDPALLPFLARAAALPGIRHVLMVRGNHEAFGSSLEEADALLADAARRTPGLVFLNRATFDVPGTDLRVAGCTLWSRVSDAQRKRVTQEVGDFRHIRGWTLERRHQEHERDVDFLVGAMGGAVRDGKRLLFLTHHAPMLHITSSQAHRTGPYTSSYECDLEAMLAPPVVAAAFGHTHFSMDVTLPGGVRLLSNQKGTPADADNCAYRANFAFDV